MEQQLGAPAEDRREAIQEIEELTESKMPFFWKELYSRVDCYFFEEEYEIITPMFDGIVCGESITEEYKKLQKYIKEKPQQFVQFKEYIPLGRTCNGDEYMIKKSQVQENDTPLYYFDHEEDSIEVISQSFEEFLQSVDLSE